MKVLIVDDNPLRAENISSFIVKEGLVSRFNVHVESCYVSAKTRLKNEYFDVLVLDVILPARVGEAPSSRYGLRLLEEINSRPAFKKPSRVIGMTASYEDIEDFRQEFAEFCFSVVEADPKVAGWKAKLCEAISYSSKSLEDKLNRKEKVILSVHGIRTYGAWQSRLRSWIEESFPGWGVLDYKYGFFTIPSFFLPWARLIEIKKFKSHLLKLMEAEGAKDFVIFCHSFGTYIVVHAIQQLLQEGERLRIDKLVLAGSVLDCDFDWGPIFKLSGTNVVNECGSKDNILWLSEALVPGTGMAGRRGFAGFESDRLRNRFYNGGHSFYFERCGFFESSWRPLLESDDEIINIDERKAPNLSDDFFEPLVRALGGCKIWIYRITFLFVLCSLLLFVGANYF